MNIANCFYVHASRVIILKGVILFYNNNVGSCGWNDIILKFENRPCIFCSKGQDLLRGMTSQPKLCVRYRSSIGVNLWLLLTNVPGQLVRSDFQLLVTCQRCTFHFLTSPIHVHLKIIMKNHSHKFRMLLTM